MSGRVVHFEVPYDDAERATAFSRTLFGWEIMAMPEFDDHGVSTGPTGNDGMPTEPGYIGGGMFRRQDSGPTMPVVTIDVDDIDRTLAAIEAQGGSAVEQEVRSGARRDWAHLRCGHDVIRSRQFALSHPRHYVYLWGRLQPAG